MTDSVPFRLRLAVSIGGPPWRRPRMSHEQRRFLIGWLWVSLYIEWGSDKTHRCPLETADPGVKARLDRA